MAIKLKTSKSEIEKALQEYEANATTDVVDALINAGAKIRSIAINNSSYRDVSGSLRGSIGFVVVVDGRIVHTSEFGVSGSPAEAKAEGRAYANEVAKRYTKGIVLIIVAGMSYASYISAKGKDVLDSAELSAERVLLALGLKNR